jgi:hypothetical protein
MPFMPFIPVGQAQDGSVVAVAPTAERPFGGEGRRGSVGGLLKNPRQVVRAVT